MLPVMHSIVLSGTLTPSRSGHRAYELAGLAAPKPLTTAYTISLGSPSEMAAAAERAAWRPLLKIKLGGGDDRERIAAVRRAAPRAELIVDANEGWTADNVAENLAACADAGVTLIEQPLPEGADEALARVARPIPVCADESVHDRASLDRLGQVRRREHQARQSRRADRGIGACRPKPSEGLRHHGRLHGSDVACDGARDAGRPARALCRPGRPAPVGRRPCRRAALRRRSCLSVRAGFVGVRAGRRSFAVDNPQAAHSHCIVARLCCRMSSDPLPLPEIWSDLPKGDTYESARTEFVANGRSGLVLIEYASSFVQSDPQPVVLPDRARRAARGERTRDEPPPAALAKGLADLTAIVTQAEALLRAQGTLKGDVHFAVERIHDVAMGLRMRDVDTALCDTLEASVREVGDAVVRHEAAATGALARPRLLRDVMRRNRGPGGRRFAHEHPRRRPARPAFGSRIRSHHRGDGGRDQNGSHHRRAGACRV